MATTMHFGPEWMRTKQQSASRPQPPPSPPPATFLGVTSASTYSALVSTAHLPDTEKRDDTHPFRYSKEEMLRIYKEGGGKGGLGLEVERWEGVVRDIESEPFGLSEMDEVEKKLFAGPLNSDLRRRQSTDFPSPATTLLVGGDRPRLNHNNSASGGPMRDRFGALRRRDGTEPPQLTIPRKKSISSAQGPLGSPRDVGLPSPRTRMGYGPGFDGVLSGGDSWVARRKAAENLAKISRSDSTGDPDGKEGEEPMAASLQPNAEHKRPGDQQFSTPLTPSSATIHEEPESYHSTNGANNITPASSQQRVGESLGGIQRSLSVPSPPQPQVDLAGIEWSYLDPQGNVQGPFLAHVMQRWYDDGYFNPDLLMRRTHIDIEWIPVSELSHRTGGSKLFLSLPLPPPAPPGLFRHTDSPMQNFTTSLDQNIYAPPYQPIPSRSLRTATLDSYLGSSSNSPSSSFGAGGLASGSPDAFGGRTGNGTFVGDSNSVSSVSAFSPALGASYLAGRSPFNEGPVDLSFGARNGAFGTASDRPASVNNYGFGGGYMTSQNPWPSNQNNSGIGFHNSPSVSSNMFSPNTDASRPGYNGGPSSYSNPISGYANAQHLPLVDGIQGQSTFDYSNDAIPSNGQHPAYLPTGYERDTVPHSQQNDVVNGSSIAAPADNDQSQVSQSPSLQQATAQVASVPEDHTPPPLQKSTTNQQPSPWGNPDSSHTRRPGPGPFDASHPKATNTAVKQNAPPPQTPTWGQGSETSRSTQAPKGASPWFTASQPGASDQAWRENPGPNSLTFDNVGAHNQQNETPKITNEKVALAAETPMPQTQTPPKPTTELLASEVTTSVAPSTTMTSKSKRKGNAQLTEPMTSAQKAQAPSPVSTKNPSPPPVPASKPAWATDEGAKKAKPSGATLGLREIQEVEAKKLEVRKAVEREKERGTRVATAAATPKTEEAQSFTSSWGLPTSRAGIRPDTTSTELPVTGAVSSSVSSNPVWTNTSQPSQTKKTMKEILEEEERRKKSVAKDTPASAAARRAYADTTNKIGAPGNNGGAWTTVGVSGKPSTPSPAGTRPTIIPTASGLAIQPSNIRSSAGPSTSRPLATKPAVIPKVDDFPVAPSHDFLKWLTDSLKGLNSSISLEDISSMLLSFPMDPDPSTVELISDLIYANSTTLDGRRFASEFVSKRKADALSKKGTTLPAKPASIADVVRTHPKPTQPEWGGFKVVNKKKKGGRS